MTQYISSELRNTVLIGGLVANLKDTNITNPLDNDVLSYDTDSMMWINQVGEVLGMLLHKQ